MRESNLNSDAAIGSSYPKHALEGDRRRSQLILDCRGVFKRHHNETAERHAVKGAISEHRRRLGGNIEETPLAAIVDGADDLQVCFLQADVADFRHLSRAKKHDALFLAIAFRPFPRE